MDILDSLQITTFQLLESYQLGLKEGVITALVITSFLEVINWIAKGNIVLVIVVRIAQAIIVIMLLSFLFKYIDHLLKGMLMF